MFNIYDGLQTAGEPFGLSLEKLGLIVLAADAETDEEVRCRTNRWWMSSLGGMMARKPIATHENNSALTQCPKPLKSMRTGNRERQRHEASASQ